MTHDRWKEDLVASYNLTAEVYAGKFLDELDRKPFDRQRLDAFAEAVKARGRVCDLGCGPGHIARYLKGRGVDAFGIDLSPRMVEIAASLNPGIPFEAGDMLALGLPDGSLAGIAAFYSLIHVRRPDVPRVLGELHRVLAPEGRLLLAVHGGEGELHVDEFLGVKTPMHGTFFQPEELAELLRRAGFKDVRAESRPPYEFEYQSTRVYLEASR